MKIIICVADVREITGGEFDLKAALKAYSVDQYVLITGMGKGAAEKLESCLCQVKGVDMIINVGTCVSAEQEPIGGVRYFHKYTNGYMGCSFRRTPHDEDSCIYTSEKFITKISDMRGAKYADMEAFHLAKVAAIKGIAFKAIKVVSDWAGNTSASTWESNLLQCSVKVRAILKEMCDIAKQVESGM